MNKILTLIFTLFFITSFSQIDTTYLNIVSWNIQNFGKSKSVEEIQYISSKVKMYDIVAIQEVSTSEFGSQAVAKLVDDLDRTGADWDYVISNPTSGSGSERYAYLFKKNRVKLKEKPTLESNLSTTISREPYKAIFIFKGVSYYLFNIHLVPVDKNPQTEANQLGIIPKLYSGKNIVILGDFNLSQEDVAFNQLKTNGLKSILIGKKTSLKMKPSNGEVLNMEYDNFFISKYIQFKNADVVYFFKDFKDLQSARMISDHCPIKISIK